MFLHQINNYLTISYYKPHEGLFSVDCKRQMLCNNRKKYPHTKQHYGSLDIVNVNHTKMATWLISFNYNHLYVFSTREYISN